MLTIYKTMIDVIRGMQPVVRRIEECDRDLGRQ
jgi:hypothetical protein